MDRSAVFPMRMTCLYAIIAITVSRESPMTGHLLKEFVLNHGEGFVGDKGTGKFSVRDGAVVLALSVDGKGDLEVVLDPRTVDLLIMGLQAARDRVEPSREA
jgi:hypothetical protein